VKGVEEIVRGLSEAQREIVRDGFQPKHRFATMEALIRKGLFARRQCFPDSNGLPVTELGLAVRASLTQDDPDA
jgi:hypothetical protein